MSLRRSVGRSVLAAACSGEFDINHSFNAFPLIDYYRNNIARNNLATRASGRVAATHGGRSTYSQRNRSTVFAMWRQCACPSNTRFTGPALLTSTNGELDRFGRFCTGRWRNSRILLYVTLRHTISSKLAHSLDFRWGILTPSNTSFLRRTQPTFPNCNLIALAVFPQYTLVTNGQVDGRTECSYTNAHSYRRADPRRQRI